MTFRLEHVAIAVFFVAISCTYEPDEAYFKDIPHEDPTTSISLNDYDEGDTIYVYKPTDFTFDAEISRGQIGDLQVTLGGQSLSTSGLTAGKFSIGLYQGLRTGTFDLEIQFTASSGTGSLADRNGLEQYQFQKKWIVKIDVDQPPVPQLRFSEENGFLKISWDPYLKPNFLEYSLNVSQSNIFNRTIKITDPSRTYWIDSSYVAGYTVHYSLYVNTVYQGRGTQAIPYTEPLVFELTNYNPSDSTAQVSWGKPKYYGAFKAYNLWQSSDAAEAVIEDVNITSLEVKMNVLFGSPSGIYLDIVPQRPAYHLSRKSIMIWNPTGGSQIPTDLFLDYNWFKGGIVSRAYDDPSVVQFLDASLETTGSIAIEGTLLTSVQGRYVLSVSGADLVQTDLQTGATKRITTPAIGTSLHANGSGTSLASFGYFINQNGTRYVETIYDFATGETLFTRTVAYTGSNTDTGIHVLSGDGKHSFRSGKIYRIESDGTLTLIGTVPGSFQGFRPDKPEEIFVASSSKMTIYLADDLSQKIALPNPGGYRVNYDPGSGQWMHIVQDENDIYFVDVETGKITHIKAAYQDVISPFEFLDGVLIDHQGYHIRIFE